ASTTGANSQR
nr:Chain Q, ALA-SER-THR-THR-GLY-ALA-ASN-SER-GLN-ARG [Porphyromonas gingivalis W83]